MHNGKSVISIVFFLSCVLLLAVTSHGQSPQVLAANPDACLYYQVQFLPEKAVLVSSDKACDTQSAEIAQMTDLNNDGRDDLILNFGACGNWGDCLYGIYVAEPSGKYKCVFRPEYWLSSGWQVLDNEVNMVSGIPWKKIALSSRTDIGGGPPGNVQSSYLQFDGTQYRDWVLQTTTDGPNKIINTKPFVVEKEFGQGGKIYQVGRLQLKEWQYGPLTLRVMDGNKLRDYVAPPVDYLEISDTRLVTLKGRPFFFVKGRYQLFLVDIEKEVIAPFLRPGIGVEYGDDAISGTMNGFQFFHDDDYLLGIAVSYGLFCFDISDINHPKELRRYSSDFSDQGQPYFFLKAQADGRWSGFVSQSDTLKKSSHISGFYTETKKAKYLFQDAQLIPPIEPFVDPVVDPKPKPFVLLYEVDSKGKKSPWVIDLKKGVLFKGKQATRFLKKQH